MQIQLYIKLFSLVNVGLQNRWLRKRTENRQFHLNSASEEDDAFFWGGGEERGDWADEKYLCYAGLLSEGHRMAEMPQLSNVGLHFCANYLITVYVRQVYAMTDTCWMATKLLAKT